MNHNLFWDLVRKDLSLYRGMTLGTLVLGMFAVFLITRGMLMFYVGSVIMLCAFVILVIFLVQFGVLSERKERVHQFVLSLPITGQQYALAKLVALALAFLVPVVLVSGLALFLVGLYPPSRGFLPFATTILLYFPLYFAVLVSVTLLSKGDGGNMATVIFFNVAINLIIPGILRIPSVGATIDGTEIVWVPELILISTLELAVSVLAIAVLLWRLRSKTEFL